MAFVRYITFGISNPWKVVSAVAVCGKPDGMRTSWRRDSRIVASTYGKLEKQSYTWQDYMRVSMLWKFETWSILTVDDRRALASDCVQQLCQFLSGTFSRSPAADGNVAIKIGVALSLQSMLAEKSPTPQQPVVDLWIKLCFESTGFVAVFLNPFEEQLTAMCGLLVALFIFDFFEAHIQKMSLMLRIISFALLIHNNLHI